MAGKRWWGQVCAVLSAQSAPALALSGRESLGAEEQRADSHTGLWPWPSRWSPVCSYPTLPLAAARAAYPVPGFFAFSGHLQLWEGVSTPLLPGVRGIVDPKPPVPLGGGAGWCGRPVAGVRPACPLTRCPHLHRQPHPRGLCRLRDGDGAVTVTALLGVTQRAQRCLGTWWGLWVVTVVRRRGVGERGYEGTCSPGRFWQLQGPACP